MTLLDRYEDGSTAFPKPQGQSPIAAFENTIEAASQEQLDEAVSDPDEMRMQALLVRERILGILIFQIQPIKLVMDATI